jgi:hypothetical protein
MPRKPRLVVEGEAAVYHVMSRTALDGFVLGDAEEISGVRCLLLTESNRTFLQILNT